MHLVILVRDILIFVLELPFLGVQRIFHLSLLSLNDVLGELGPPCHSQGVRLFRVPVSGSIRTHVRFAFHILP